MTGGRLPGAAGIAALAFLACATEPAPDLVVAGVTLVDVERGVPVADRTILVRGGRIIDVRAAAAADRRLEAGDCVDGRGMYAIPGLWDMHVHALWRREVAEAFLPELTRHGITGIRDMGGDLEVVEEVRGAPRSKRRRWPRIVAAGPVLDGPEPVDPEISLAVASAAEAVAAVDELAARSVDLLKVYTLLPREAYFAVVDRAAQLGLPVAGHVPAEVTVLEAVRAGQASIEHLRDELEPFCHQLAGAACRELIREMAAAGLHNTPTLAILQAKTLPGYGAGDGEAGGEGLPAAVRDAWRAAAASQAARPDEYFEWRRERFLEELALVGELHRGGAPLLAGSDAGSPSMRPGESLHQELALLVEAGLTPAEALRAATLGATRFLGLDRSVGALRPGLAADLVLLEADPLERISNVGRIGAVIREGRPVGEGAWPKCGRSGPPADG